MQSRKCLQSKWLTWWPMKVLLKSSEAHFHLGGYGNKQNFLYWSAANPEELHERFLHSPKVPLWCGDTKTFVIGPYFFQERIQCYGQSQCWTILWSLTLKERFIARKNVVFLLWEQDGATAHISNMMMRFLRSKFRGRIIIFMGTLHEQHSLEISFWDFVLVGVPISKSLPTLDEL